MSEESAKSAQTAAQATEYSKEFNDSSAEITYESSDQVRFRIHAIYLKIHTEGLSPPEGSSMDEIVPLTEVASTLEMLFKFIYPIHAPTLDNLDHGALKELAEAAEKYQVFPAMYACFLQMRATLPAHATSLLGYATKHDYDELVDEAAPHTLDASLSEITDTVPAEFHKAWLLYRNKWLSVQKRAVSTYNQNNSDMFIMAQLAKSFEALRSIESVSNPQTSGWMSAIVADIKNVPKLTELSGARTTPMERPLPDDPSESKGWVTIKSSDGIHHYVDPVVLKACKVDFGQPSANGKIHVPEHSSIISLLLQFLRPVRCPSIGGSKFKELKEVAFTSEKYSISQAKGICRTLMKRTLPEHASEVFQYAARFRYIDILDEAAPLILPPNTSFEDTVKDLPSSLVIPWAQYYQAWEDISQITINTLIKDATMTNLFNNQYRAPGYCDCGNHLLQTHVLPILKELSQGPGTLRSLNSLHSVNANCGTAMTIIRQCREVVEKAMKAIKPLSSFI